MNAIGDYARNIAELLEKIVATETGNLDEAAEAIFNVYRQGGKVYVFGCTHSAILSEEVCYRAGELAIFIPVFGPGMSVVTTPPVITSALERNEQIGRDIVASSRFTAADAIVVNSTSGKNAVPVEVALGCKRLGMSVIAVTSKAYGRFPANHSSGRNLGTADLDVVIDNHVRPGDCGADVGGLSMAPVSTIAGTFIMHAISIRITEKMQAAGITPPLLMSANVPGGAEHNAAILDKDEVRAVYNLP